ncbi:golgin subfamily A member 6-like protein 22 [Osmia bicornis bicornis]|uniref:golgin subfamily A member 6-like protein 22 n=1 Tax=Osmia bicornis bicornis TaxID=1437191 RepID=UPI001EAF19C5|nr:golgin subfamily A member 6-like protein 22 [Osmia bicornis bicornis]
MAGKEEEGAEKRTGTQRMEGEAREKKEGEAREEPEKPEKGGKRGRPSNIEVLRREKKQSLGSMANLEEMWKRKREEGNEEVLPKEKEDEERRQTNDWMFRGSSLTGRSPEKKKERREGEGGVGEIKEFVKDLGKDLGGKIGRVEANMRALGSEIRGEMEKLKEDTMRREVMWAEQKREMEGKIEILIKKIGELEKRGEEGARWNEIEQKVHKTVQESIEKRKEELGGEKVNEKIIELEKKLEKKEREERKKNITITGTKVRKEGVKEKAEEILKIIGVEDAIEEAKEVGGVEKGKYASMILVKIKSSELKRRIMENKKRLKGREERIEDDLTWAERKTQWTLRKIGREEREKGKYVWVDHGKIRIEGKWWRWDDEKGALVDWEGKEWKAYQEGGQRKGEGEKGT